jgi:hypothetical protein
MLPIRERLPEHTRRSIRLFLGVSIPCLVGFGVIGPEHVRYSNDVSSACKWAAITAAIVAQPLIGKASQVGLERLLGTLIGGLVGYVVHQLGLLIFGEAMDGIFKSLAAGALASLSVLVGEKRLKLNTSAKLFVVTLLLVTFAGEYGDIEGYAVARVCGILLGVCLMLLLSIVVFPKSATVEALHNMDDALESLSYLTLVVWKGYPQEEEVTNGGMEEPLLEEKRDRNMENALTKLYESLFNMEENMNAAASETLVMKSSTNSLIVIPRLSIGESQSPASHLPVVELNDMADAVRKVARALFTLEKALEDWNEVWDQTSDDESTRNLETIRRSIKEVSDEIQDCFPLKDSMDPQLLLTMIKNINKWESLGRDKKDQITPSKAITIRNSLRHLEQQASFSLSMRHAYDFGSFDPHAQEEETTDVLDTEQDENIMYPPEWSTLTFALQELGSEFGALWHQCEIVLQRLPYNG